MARSHLLIVGFLQSKLSIVLWDVSVRVEVVLFVVILIRDMSPMASLSAIYHLW